MSSDINKIHVKQLCIHVHRSCQNQIMCNFQIKEGSLTSSFGKEFHDECNAAGQTHKTPGDYSERNTKYFNLVIWFKYVPLKVHTNAGIAIITKFNHYT